MRKVYKKKLRRNKVLWKIIKSPKYLIIYKLINLENSMTTVSLIKVVGPTKIVKKLDQSLPYLKSPP